MLVFRIYVQAVCISFSFCFIFAFMLHNIPALVVYKGVNQLIYVTLVRSDGRPAPGTLSAGVGLTAGNKNLCWRKWSSFLASLWMRLCMADDKLYGCNNAERKKVSNERKA